MAYLRFPPYLQVAFCYYSPMKPSQSSYYRKQRDAAMWSEFDRTAIRLALPLSSALTEAAREWVETHRGDPTVIPELDAPSRMKTLPPGTRDPFGP